VSELTDTTDRAERMSRIRAEIENGTYRSSGRDIARKVIDAHRR
jgi:anti-sigma28 factor (negative regulator of flagellin synthesis)